MMRFGTAGIPISCKERSSIDGIQCVSDLGLDAFEFEFVRGCRLNVEKAKEAGRLAKKLGISVSCHASYYLNLLSPEKIKYDKTIKELAVTARILNAAGGRRLVFHPGYYLKMPHDQAYEKMKEEFKALISAIKEENLDVVLAPETTGKPTAFGSIEELYQLAGEIGYDYIRPCIDWAHVHARGNGRIKGRKDYDSLFELVEKHTGKEGLKSLHCHMSSINFTAKGERNHMTMDNNIPSYEPLAQALVDFNCSGVIISESPNIEVDALYMKKTYEKILNKSK